MKLDYIEESLSKSADALRGVVSEIEETRGRIGGLSSSVSGLALPLWVLALIAAYIAYRLT